MSIIKVVNGEKKVIANVSVTDHSQLSGREAYGAHPISAIRKLPEKLYELKEKTVELENKIAAHDSEVDLQLEELTAQINAKIDEVNLLIENNQDLIENALSDATAEADTRLDALEEGVQKVSLIEDAENKGKLTFTNYNGESVNVQGGFLPDDITLQLTEEDSLELKNKPDEETIITDNGKIYATAIKDNGNSLTASEYNSFKESTTNTIESTIDALDLLRQETVVKDNTQDNEITKLKHLTTGMGGYLDSYNFGKVDLTQEELFTYALQETNATSNEEIFTGTRVINTYNDHTWVLVNTPDTDPVILEWIDLGDIQPIDVATEDTYGLVKSSNEDLTGKVDLTGQITINGLQEKLTSINNTDTNLQTQIDEIAADKKYLHSISGRISLGPCYGSISFQFINDSPDKMSNESALGSTLTDLGFTGTSYSNANALPASGYYRNNNDNTAQGLIYGIYANGTSVYCIYAKRAQSTTTLLIDNVETTVVTNHQYEREIMSTYSLTLGMGSYIKEVVTEI